MAGEPDGRRQRRWREVHDRIYRAAIELFLAKGYLATSYDEIADRADVARKTAFNHFPRKRDLTAEWGRRRRDQAEHALRLDIAEGADTATLIRRYFGELGKINVAERPLTRRMLGAWRESGGPFDNDMGELGQVFSRMLAEGQRRHDIRMGSDPERAGTLLYSAYFGTLFDWIAGSDEEPPFDLAEAFTFLLDVVLPGLQGPPTS